KIPILYPAVITGFFFFEVFTAEGSLAESENITPYYQVVDNRVDAKTFMGWRVFHINCHSCHGIDAVGTDVAPNPVEMVKTMGPNTFAIKVLKRYRITVGMNQASSETDSASRNAIIDEMLRQQRGKEGELVMPGREEFNPGIRAHILDQYAYLKARANGVLKPGRPELIKE
ncbi:MAG: c-type cytochrome, partial [Gammaproteobacteria bacterium]